MPTDRYGLALSTAPVAYDGAIVADPGFAVAHAGKAQALIRQDQVAEGRAVLTAAKEVAAGVSEREASHIGFFELVFAGQTDAAIAALQEHLAAWPRDALVVASAASANGVIANSGRIGQKHQIAVLMDSLAPQYGDDFWFLCDYAMALSEDGQLHESRSKIEQSLAANPKNAHAATRAYHDAFALDRHSGGPQQKMWDGASVCRPAARWKVKKCRTSASAGSGTTASCERCANGSMPRSRCTTRQDGSCRISSAINSPVN